MKLPRLAIENHQFTLVIIAVLVLSGVVSFFTMPRSEDPLVYPAGTSVVVIYPGASPVDLEQLVVDPIEKVLNELEDFIYIQSSIEDGLAIIQIEFEVGSDPDEKYSDVTQKVNSVREQMPEDIYSLEVVKWSITDTKIMQIALISEAASYSELRDEAERLEEMLKPLYGVQNIEIEGCPLSQVRVSLDLERMAAMGISLKQVEAAIRATNADIPGGTVEIGSRKFTLHTSGDYTSLEDIKRPVISAYGGRMVYLSNIAEVEFGYEDQNYIARFDGRRAVFISMSQKENTNIYKVMEGIRSEVERFGEKLPAGMVIETVLDQSESVSGRLWGFFQNFIQGVVLVGMVILLALGLRAAGIVMLAIPFSIVIAIGFVDLSGYGIQQMTIVGLVIALGLLVDNAIVVVENVSRFRNKGYGNFEAAVAGTSQIGWAIVSATATTVLAFTPLAMIKSMAGDFMRSMPLSVIYCLSASLLLALTFTPYLSERFLGVGNLNKPSRARRLLDGFIQKRYRRIISAALRRPRTVLIVALSIFVVSLALLPVVGFSLFPKSGKMQLMVDVWAPDGTNIGRTDEIASYVESVLNGYEEIEHYATNVGHGNPRVYYNMFSSRTRSQFAQFFVKLGDIGTDRMQNLIGELRAEFSSFPGARIEVKEFEQGPPIEAPVVIRLIGDELDRLKEVASHVEKIISTTPGTVNIDNPLKTTKTDLGVRINRDNAAMLGVMPVDIDRTVRTALSGTAVTKYRDSRGEEYDIVLRLPLRGKPGPADFDRIMVPSRSGAQIPLRELATLEFKAAPAEINHYDLERYVMITADIRRGYSVDRATRTIISRLDEYDWPAGCRYAVGGEMEERSKTFAGMTRAIIIAVLSIFGVLVLQFRSFKQPLVVFIAIPMAVIGSVLALLIAGYTFSFSAFVGLASLMGIVVNNSIILVVYTNQLRDEGKGLVDALKEAGETRFIPIILTTATTISGLLPLTIMGGDLWGPLGWSIIGGLLVSTALTLVVVPVLYKLVEGRKVAEEG
jgi:multidrug efflux pump subunit AcrB